MQKPAPGLQDKCRRWLTCF